MPELAIPFAIVAIMGAIFAAILLWNSRSAFRAVLQGLSQLPFVGAFIAGRLEVLTQAMIDAAAGWARSALQPLADLVNNAYIGLVFFMDATTKGIQASYGAVHHVLADVLPALERRITGWVSQLYAQLLDLIIRVYHDLATLAWQLYANAIAYAGQVFVRAVAYAQALFGQAVALAEAVYTQAVAFAQVVLVQAVAFTQAVLAQALAYTGQLFAQAVAFTQAAVGTAIDLERRLYGDLVGLLARDFVLLRDYAQGIGAQANAYTLASVSAVLARVINLERSKCQQFCEPLGDLGQALQDLENLGLAALMLALAAELARDPQGSARTINQVAGGPLRGLLKDLEAEASVAA